MSIRLAIEHRTVYSYDRPVRLGPHVMRLRPAPHCRTPILAYSLKVTPGDHFINWQQDPSGNYLARFVFPEPTSELTITVGLVADMTVINPFDFFLDEAARSWPFRYDDVLARDLAPYLDADGTGPLVSDWLAEIPRDEAPTIDFLVALNGAVLRDVGYSVRMEHGVQSPEETLSSRIGSCRDSAWLLVQVLRALGIAARFASGYLVQLAEDAPTVERPSGPAGDFTDLHAWAEAYVPGAGWIGLDPTSGLLTGEGHIPLACTSTPAAAAPVTGSAEPSETKLEFSNNVRRIHEDPRVTLPYATEQWERIDALGRLVDADLLAGDARLTMGGEPTFVARDDMDAPEWNTAADGPTKRRLATALTLRLAARLAPGALIQHTQGKWYPGEPLPRWQIGVHWRTDGHPVWRDPGLLADPTEPGASSADDVAKLGRAIAHAFGLASDVLVPAYEDPLGRLWAESKLPEGDPPTGAATEPPQPALADAATRVGIVATLDAERGVPCGWALPLHRAAGQSRWSTGRWAMRRGHLFLIAGDSPIG
ncbi:MAG TPA: transglutaminase family protein, partial [Solirubrobacteraceae bacterium]|nr:transglutaminase family protein [Solirubrobacteraceae bacterium]